MACWMNDGPQEPIKRVKLLASNSNKRVRGPEEIPALFLHTPGVVIIAVKRNRPDKDGPHQAAFERAKKIIYATQTVCGICGQPVDFSKSFPDPLSPCIDHIIPVSKGGHPSDMDNLQLAHLWCNRQKSNKLVAPLDLAQTATTIKNDDLPQSIDWKAYRSE